MSPLSTCWITPALCVPLTVFTCSLVTSSSKLISSLSCKEETWFEFLIPLPCMSMNRFWISVLQSLHAASLSIRGFYNNQVTVVHVNTFLDYLRHLNSLGNQITSVHVNTLNVASITGICLQWAVANFCWMFVLAEQSDSLLYKLYLLPHALLLSNIYVTC